MSGNLRILSDELISLDGIRKEEMAVNATTIVIVYETNPALTIASPITKPPTIPIVWPTRLGSRSPASLKSSNISSRIIASTIGG